MIFKKDVRVLMIVANNIHTMAVRSYSNIVESKAIFRMDTGF